MNINFTWKKLVKWVGVVVSLWFILSVCNELFIRQWRIDYSEKRVRQSIQHNYQENKETFTLLFEFIRGLNLRPFVDITFLKKDEVRSHIRTPFYTDSLGGAI